jgi:2-amino-4-hydroxy-6-hydroxymethyldihydropteridine diphosphokinase
VLATLRSAREQLAQLGALRSSRLYRGPAWGPPQPDYLNAAVRVEGQLPEPGQLLLYLQGIERAHGRVRTVRFGPRTLDLDLLDVDGLHLQSAELELPHPRLLERPFVLRPVLDLEPDYRHPDGRTAASALAGLQDLTELLGSW